MKHKIDESIQSTQELIDLVKDSIFTADKQT